MTHRRAYSQQNLEFEQGGPLGALLAEALRVSPQGGHAHTHGFHPYPGRFHPNLARTILEQAVEPACKVFDPFMGGGTTLVEAILRGHETLGNDLNPVATLVARERTRPRTNAQAQRLVDQAKKIAAQVETLRREKKAPRVHLRHMDRLAPHYQKHLLAELTQWIRLIRALPEGAEKETLLAVFSSGVVKFSNRPSDTREGSLPPRYPKGAVSRFFARKSEELGRKQEILGRKLPRPPQVNLLQEDARLLPSLGWNVCGVILTSPPYPGTYDYFDQHSLRMDWLELEGELFRTGEMAPRRGKAEETWTAGIREVLTTLARVLSPQGAMFMAVGDWIENTHAVDGGKALKKAAEAKDWNLSSWARVRRSVHSRQENRAFAKRGKWEHLLHLARKGGDERAKRPE